MTDIYLGLGVVDYVILSVLLLISASIGVYYRFSGGRQRTTKVSYHFFHNSEETSNCFLSIYRSIYWLIETCLLYQ